MYIFGSRGRAILTNWSRSKWAPRCRFIIIYLRRALNHAYQAEFARRRHQPHGRNREESRRRERKVVSPPRIINRLANLTSVVYFRIALYTHTHTARYNRADTRAPWFMRKSGPLFPRRSINKATRVTRVISGVLRSYRRRWYLPRDRAKRSVNTFPRSREYIILSALN